MHADEAGHSEPASAPGVQDDCSLKAVRADSPPIVKATVTLLAVFDVFRLPVSAVVSERMVLQGEAPSPLLLCHPTRDIPPPQISS